MSQIALSPPAGGTGVFTIAAPATNTNRTLTILDADGTVATSASTLAQFNASGSAPVFASRAWVNFDGTGTVAIRASGNVSSITDNGVGDYTVNFATAMQDANYVMTTSGLYLTTDTNYKLTFFATTTPATTTSVRVFSSSASGNAALDTVINCVSIFR